MKYLYIFFFILIVNCTGNKLSNYHGSKLLDEKYNKIFINKTNKNDLLLIIGPPSSISDFNKNKWYYFERLKSNQSLLKLGKQKIKKNNILVVELNGDGILIDKKLFNLEDMNDLKYLKTTTQKEFKKDGIMYNVFSSLREKINSPIRNKQK